MPTHAPTGSTRLSLVVTAIFERKPGSRTTLTILTVLSKISGTSSSKSRARNSGQVREMMTCGPLGLFLHFDDAGADGVALAVPLLADLFPVRHHGLGAAEVDEDVALVDLLHRAGDQFADALAVIREDLFAFGLAHALEDDLLGGLDGRTAEPVDIQVLDQLVADLKVRVGLPASSSDISFSGSYTVSTTVWWV